MARLPVLVSALAGACIGLGLSLSTARVLQLERGELETESGWATLDARAPAKGSTRVSARLLQVRLRAGERALFELCARDRLDPSVWRDAFEVAVFRLPEMRLMLRVPLDAAHLAVAKRNPNGACLALGGGRIDASAEYSVDAIWPSRVPTPAVRSVKLNLRVIARTDPTANDRALVAAIGAGALLAVGVFLFARRARSDASAPQAPIAIGPARVKPVLGAALGLAAILAVMEVPSHGATLTLLKGVLLVALQAGLAFALARLCVPEPPRLALGLRSTWPPWAVAGAGVLSAFALFLLARLALRVVPSTGEAPIQTFIEWPSGMLCFAVLGCVLPLGEELFFRGYLYRAALGFGRLPAYAGSFAAFVALHAQQSWGEWGALTSIALAGALLTALRAWSGSILVPAIAHLLYNFALSMASF